MSESVTIRSFHVIIDAPPEAVFDFVQDLRNLPSWSIHFCKGVRLTEDGAVVHSPSGDVYFGVTGDRDLGVLDWWCGPTMETAERWPTRVVALPDGRSTYQVTAIFTSPTPANVDQLFADELGTLKRLVEAAAADVWEQSLATR
ncbi:MAG TPA: hypothetical protein VFD67_04875 [Gemmatimonadaceae bacterium]|nr:hypothetical protein [Gemmatimonadaceae bacterium]